MQASVTDYIEELINTFSVNQQFNYDATNDTLMPSLESEANPYALQCLLDWVYNLEQNDTIIQLDFDRIENDIQQLQTKYGNHKCVGLFYPNWKPFKYIFDYDSYAAKHYDRSIYERNKQKIQKVYMKLFGNTESIIHYILANKSFLFKLPQPDFDRKQQKLDKLTKMNGESLMKLNMKQSISILRLLLFKHKIISPNALFKDNCTLIYDIEETMREIMIDREFVCSDMKQSYLDLICDIYTISTNESQQAIINIFTKQEFNEETKESEMEWYHFNFFDDCAVRDYGKSGRSPAKISLNVAKELLFRGIPPWQIINREHLYDYEIETYNHVGIEEQTKLFEMCLHKTIEKFSFDDKLHYRIKDVTTPMIPYFICEIAEIVKEEMYNLLNHCLKSVLTQNCVQCIVGFIFVDWAKLLPIMPNIDSINEEMIMKVGKFFNFVAELNLEEMNEDQRKKLFDEQYLNEKMATFFLTDLDEFILKDLIANVFVCENAANLNLFGMKALYSLSQFVELSDDSLLAFINSSVTYRGPYMDGKAKRVFVDIVSAHVFDEETLGDDVFMNNYRIKISDYLDKLYTIPVWREKVDMRDKFIKYIVDDSFPSDFLLNTD